MRRDELQYELPHELIAQEPSAQRRASRLLIVNRSTGQLLDQQFSDVRKHLSARDVLVLNNTRVVPARFFLKRASGGRIEGLWLEQHARGAWSALLRPSRALRSGETLTFEDSPEHQARIVECGDRGRHTLEIAPPTAALELLERIGHAPLPPYIKREGRRSNPQDLQRYQTVYAREAGAIAAPTAGLHFDDATLDGVRADGIPIVEVTLHVGWGTFAPIEVNDLATHPMHHEFMDIRDDARQMLDRARADGRRIVAVGTTAARVLESLASRGLTRGQTNLFIYPPYEFQFVGALLTNFHLPESTLLAMVYALGGVDLMRRAYAHAVAQRYRFFSYGDAMLVV